MHTNLSKNRIVSIIKDSFQEYEGEQSLVLFYAGCNLNCKYCYNKDVINSGVTIGKSFDEILKEEITPLHTAVVFLGGEPTHLAGDTIANDIRYAKSLGLKTKLFTNGLKPEVLRECLKAGLDAVSIDVKFGEHFNYVVGVQPDISYHSKIVECLDMMELARIKFEIRSTYWSGMLKSEKENLDYVGKYLSKKYIVEVIQQQDFRDILP